MSSSIRNLMGSGLAANAAGAIGGISATGLVATGTTQANALPLPQDFNVFSTVAAGTGCILSSTNTLSDSIDVVNLGANPLLVYPPVGSTIGNAAVNVALSIPAGKMATFQNCGPTQWIGQVSA